MSAEKVISTARSELGTSESPPGSNRTKYGAAYGLDGYSWCVMFLWWCFREAGESAAFYSGGKTAGCGAMMREAQAKGRWVTSGFRPGDLVILNFSGTRDTEHCGIVTEVYPDGSVGTIEGNTTPGLEGSQASGGSVAKKRREKRYILGACRPPYAEAAAEKPDYAGHWAEAAIRAALKSGRMRGYPDGSFRPDEAVTRAELAVVLERMEAQEGIE